VVLLGTTSFAAFADLKAEERKRKNRKLEEEMVKEFRMIKQRRFRYRISGISLNPEEKITACFLHFSIGGLSKEVTTEYDTGPITLH
jgi:hypothetical protein